MANYVTSSGGPVRPPRTFKTTKDSNGLLISVIRSLSASQNSADRDREKAKLEKDFKRSDQKLDDLVAQNKEDLTRAMQDFSKISSRISASRSKVQCIKEKLTTCKTLLHCKRDELKKLWLEAVEHKHVLQLLEEIESLVEVPDKIDAFLSKKQYLHATQLLVSSVNLVEGSLEGVEALKDVKGKLISKKERMYEDLVDELHRHLYLRRTTEALQKFRRQSSDRKVQLGPVAQSRSTLTDLTSVVSGLSITSQEMRNASSATLNSSISSSLAGEPETSSLLRLEESGQFSEAPHLAPKYTAILVRCLALLNRIPDTVEQHTQSASWYAESFGDACLPVPIVNALNDFQFCGKCQGWLLLRVCSHHDTSHTTPGLTKSHDNDNSTGSGTEESVRQMQCVVENHRMHTQLCSNGTLGVIDVCSSSTQQ